jgi:hypothetical protein
MSSIPVEPPILRSQRTASLPQPIVLSYWYDSESLVRQVMREHRKLVRNLVVMVVVLLSLAIGMLAPTISRLIQLN